MFFEYTNKTKDQIYSELGASALGLSQKEAVERLRQYGPNVIRNPRNAVREIIKRQFRSPFFYLLFIAGAVALFIGEKVDSLVIFCFVLVNFTLGFLQEFRAERAAKILKKLIPEKVKVIRSGRRELTDKKSLVPGDLLVLQAGDTVPADARVVWAESVLVDESAISGESNPVIKNENSIPGETKEIFKASNVLFSGTSVVAGEAKGIVIGSGSDTYLGEITGLVASTERESAYEKNLLSFSRNILKIVVATIVAVYILNLIVKGSENIFSFTIFCIALIVSILPEALPLIATVALTKGSLLLAKKSVVVKRLSAVEDLGNVEILCADKTGTLTENKLTVHRVFAPEEKKCFFFGLLGSSYLARGKEHMESPFDRALLLESSQQDKDKLKGFSLLDEIPFDHFRLRGDSLVESPTGDKYLIMRGAPEVVLRYSKRIAGSLSRGEILNQFKNDAGRGCRVLAVAFKKVSRLKKSVAEKDEKNLTFIGYISFTDPLKKTAKETVRLASKLGLEIKILTGDVREAAGEIARGVGLIKDLKRVVTGEELSRMPEKEFKTACAKYAVFARVTPAMKIEIIKALQEEKEVGFLGEGVNDAPALKLANVGVAVKEAVDISREVSDIVLLHKDMRVIVEGIREGRNVFSNINKYIKCTLAANFGNFYSIAAISLFVNFIPMKPVQILLVNLLSDFPLIAVATDSVDTAELRKPKAYILEKTLGLIVLLAIVNSIADLIIFFLFRASGEAMIQTVWFTEGVLTEIALIFVVRSRLAFFRAKAPSRMLVLLSVLAFLIAVTLPFTKIGQDFFHLTSPSNLALGAIISLVLGYFAMSEIIKLAYFRFSRQASR